MRKIRQYVRERQYIMHVCAKTTVQCDGLQRIYSTLPEGVERGFGVLPQKIFATISKKSQ